MEVLDPGHKYKLNTLDGDDEQILRFVKRNDPPQKYPGNTDAYSGTTTQDVMRCLIDRMEYVENQAHNPVNLMIANLLRMCIWLLEARAAEKKNKALSIFTLDGVETYPTHHEDGHIFPH
jgi:hypothetical protein